IKLITYEMVGEKWEKKILREVTFEVEDDGSPLPDSHPAKKLVVEILRRVPGYHGRPNMLPTEAPLPENVYEIFTEYVEVAE
ncbi:MAG: hypothetical protein QXF58_06250, partial [Desulfurococcaceae archaeon]